MNIETREYKSTDLAVTANYSS